MQTPTPTPTPDAAPLVEAQDLALVPAGGPPIGEVSFEIGPGLSFVRGGEGRGKTTLLRLIAGTVPVESGTLRRHASSVFLDDAAAQPADERVTGRQWLQARRAELGGWDVALERDLIAAFALGEHVDKGLHMLSTGSRRKLGLVAAFAGDARIVLLDVPFAALDARGRALLAGLLDEVADSPTRAFVVADYELPDGLAETPLSALIDLGD